MDLIALREDGPTASRAGHQIANNCEARNWSNNTFEGKEPADLVRRDIVERQADEPIYEVANHEPGCDVGRFGKLVRDISKPWPDGKNH